jgi:hypothetical protein
MFPFRASCTSGKCLKKKGTGRKMKKAPPFTAEAEILRFAHGGKSGTKFQIDKKVLQFLLQYDIL